MFVKGEVVDGADADEGLAVAREKDAFEANGVGTTVGGVGREIGQTNVATTVGARELPGEFGFAFVGVGGGGASADGNGAIELEEVTGLVAVVVEVDGFVVGGGAGHGRVATTGRGTQSGFDEFAGFLAHQPGFAGFGRGVVVIVV